MNIYIYIYTYIYDYKKGVNYKVYLDSYPIPNTEYAFHALAGKSAFTK